MRRRILMTHLHFRPVSTTLTLVIFREQLQTNKITQGYLSLSFHPSVKISMRSRRGRSEKRIKFKDKYDCINGRYFIFTLPYGLYYIISAIVIYSGSKSLLFLLVSGILGLLLVLLGVGHSIDYYRKADIESLYVAIPCGEIHRMLEISLFLSSFSFSFFVVLSLFVAILMSAIWAMGTAFHSSSIFAVVVRKEFHLDHDCYSFTSLPPSLAYSHTHLHTHLFLHSLRRGLHSPFTFMRC